eukprot:m.306807 g.306807  ORF g.306807 m.306807 type:complete len:796 (+) comp41600_c0_seq1:94-2481(+)
MKLALLFFGVALLANGANADCYLHNPRGSNNRLDEANRDRNNGNRMFDSQNNNRGGYNVGSLYYYSGSVLNVEWTNQHSCNGPNTHCELVMQYMCGELVRDGSTTSTIPSNPANCRDYNCNTDMKYGMHETYNYYLDCKSRERNMGLFTADRNLNGNAAIYTRQNPGGTRRAYECPEERDHYPYWHPTPWKDVAVLTNDPTRCVHYEEESENVKGRHYCNIPLALYNKYSRQGRRGFVPNNEADCIEVQWPEKNMIKAGENVSIEYGKWTLSPSHDIPKPECKQTQFSRDNHLGNTVGGFPLMFNWTIPDINHEHCVFRIRYNITSGEFDGWDSSVNASKNKQKGKNYADLDIASRFGLQHNNADGRGYVFKQNPVVEIFDEFDTTPVTSGNDKDFGLRLAISTNQFGRTFQDRSHTFAVRPRPDNLDCGVIHNLNVRGKRGNIVQTYPGVEYDFVPNRLHTRDGDCVHFQWTGSNTNPNNNDGQGKAGTDRSNIVMLEPQRYAEGNGVAVKDGSKVGHWGNSYPEHLDNSKVQFLGLGKDTLDQLAGLTHFQFRGELSELDDSGTYFDLGPKKVTGVGEYHYLCTRNNNFSNRSQKGKMYVNRQAQTWAQVDWNGGKMEIGQNKATFPRDSRNTPVQARMEEWKSADCDNVISSLNRNLPAGDSTLNCIAVYPQERLTKDNRTFNVEMSVDPGFTDSVTVYSTTGLAAAGWKKLSASSSNGMVSFAATDGAIYVARSTPNVPEIAGGVAAAAVILIAVLGTVLFFYKKPEKWTSFKKSVSDKAQYAKRSFQSKV